MRRKVLLLLIGIVIVGVTIVSLSVSIITLLPRESEDPPIEPPSGDPYEKAWEDHHLSLYDNDYYLLNYTFPSSYSYHNFCDDFEYGCLRSDWYPPIYAVSSAMFENFSMALEDPYFDHYEDPILEKVFVFERQRYCCNDYSFTPPYLDTWYIFVCNDPCGTNRFTYSDMIYKL